VKVECSKCDGEGKVKETCDDCDGEGKVSML
jgi:DnaJ-class molecular chaperone